VPEAQAPKPVTSAFAFSAQSRRPSLLAVRPELEQQLVEQKQLLVAEWRVLNDIDMAFYEGEAARDRDRYEAERAAFHGQPIAREALPKRGQGEF